MDLTVDWLQDLLKPTSYRVVAFIVLSNHIESGAMHYWIYRVNSSPDKIRLRFNSS